MVKPITINLNINMAKYDYKIWDKEFEVEVSYTEEYLKSLWDKSESDIEFELKKAMTMDFWNKSDQWRDMILYSFSEYVTDKKEIQDILYKETVSDWDFDLMDKYMDDFIREKITLTPITD